MKYIVYKHRFYYTKSRYNEEKNTSDTLAVGPCTLEFIVPISIDKNKLMETVDKTFREFSTTTSKTGDGLVMYAFGSLDVIDFLDDLVKVVKINLNSGDFKMHLWLDASPEISYWVEPE